MTEERMTEEELAEEARRWAAGEVPAGSLVDAPDAVPRARESVAISIRLPRQMVEILKEFARREGIGYQVLLKRWLDDRIQEERKRRRQQQASIQLESLKVLSQAAASKVEPLGDPSDEARTDVLGCLIKQLLDTAGRLLESDQARAIVNRTGPNGS